MGWAVLIQTHRNNHRTHHGKPPLSLAKDQFSRMSTPRMTTILTSRCQPFLPVDSRTIDIPPADLLSTIDLLKRSLIHGSDSKPVDRTNRDRISSSQVAARCADLEQRHQEEMASLQLITHQETTKLQVPSYFSQLGS